jgi:hypothetical protein
VIKLAFSVLCLLLLCSDPDLCPLRLQLDQLVWWPKRSLGAVLVAVACMVLARTLGEVKIGVLLACSEGLPSQPPSGLSVSSNLIF